MIASELPVYRDTFVLVSTITDLPTNFPKMYKYTFGEKLMKVSLDLFEYIQLANMETSSPQRYMYLKGFQVKFELLKVLLRLCAEKKIISVKQSANLALMTTNIGRQITAWKNVLTKDQSPKR